MSLAAILLQDGARPASMLPSIKCSTCGNDIAIAAMGDHVCSNDSLPDQRPSFGNSFVTGNNHDTQRPAPHMKTRSRAHTLNKKLPRMPLPNINADAANKPFWSRTEPGLGLSLTPARSDCGSEDTAMMRYPTRTAPHAYNSRPPSPELSANLDCAFPPFAMTDIRPPAAQERRKPSDGDQVPSQPALRTGQMLSVEPDVSRWEPRSPNTKGGENVLQRFNTLQDGPFAATRGQHSTGSTEWPGQQAPRPPRTPTFANGETYMPPLPCDLYSNADVDDSRSSQRKMPPPRPARPSSREVLSQAFLNKLNAETLESHTPSTTTQHGDQSGRGHTTPSTGERSGDHTHTLSLSRTRSESAMRADSGAPAPLRPPRSASRSGTRTDYRPEDAPPVPRPVLRHRHEASMHAPSESGSSAASTSYSGSTDGFRPSPGASPASSVENFSPLAKAVMRQDGDAHQMRPAGLSARIQQEPGMRAESPKACPSPRDFARKAISAQHQADPKHCFVAPPPKSPMHPVTPIQPVASEPYPDRPTTRARSPYETPSAPNTRSLQSTCPPRSTPQDSVASQAPSDIQERRSPRRRAPTVNKAVCRGCNQAIEGKSVKAADGRLTGRWHKACFVCRSCKAPFLTADFYVMHNEPYCEHHYHEKNGSLCHGCNRGIEGQYLETTSTTRNGVVDKLYHPTCFTCVQCRSVLTDSYFEITGQVYCERHALAAMRAQTQPASGHGTGGRSGGLIPHDRRNQLLAERRTTRLINPMTA